MRIVDCLRAPRAPTLAASAAHAQGLALTVATAALLLAGSPPRAAHAAGLLEPPGWTQVDNGVSMQRTTDTNSKLTDKAAKRVFDAGVELANRGADEEEQVLNDKALQKAEERFSLLIDGEEGIEPLAPNFYGGYTNRGNVRVARGNYAGAAADYVRAIQLAPLAEDLWVTELNLGQTLLAMKQPNDALRALQQSVVRSKGDRYTLLGRGSAYHTLGRFGEAAADYGQVITKNPTDIQPFWIRCARDRSESGI